MIKVYINQDIVFSIILKCCCYLSSNRKGIEKYKDFHYNILNKEVVTIDEVYPFPAK